MLFAFVEHNVFFPATLYAFLYFHIKEVTIKKMSIELTLYRVALVMIFHCVAVSTSSQGTTTCLPTDDKCEFWLTIEERLILHKDKTRVYAKDGVLYKHDEGPDNHKTKVSIGPTKFSA